LPGVFDEVLEKLPYMGGGMLLIEPHVLEELMKYRQLEAGDAEAGGILMGYRRGAHLHITDIPVPQAKDVRRRFSFQRNDRKHQAIALQRWEKSEKRLDYLGEWHTHPEKSPSPSPLDKSEWRKILVRNRNPMVFVILGTSIEWWLGAGIERAVRHILIRPTAENGAPFCESG
jgi:integrative and conjugative element protein (TIGR02256 family)